MLGADPHPRGLTWAQVRARRLAWHALSEPAADASIADIVARICGTHAQVMAAAELSIGLRMHDVTRSDVQHALRTERSLVKTFGPRGTVHLLPARDLAMWTTALSQVPLGTDGLSVELRMTEDQMDAVIRAMDDALADTDLTTEELGEQIVSRTGAWAGELVIPAFLGMWPRWRRALIPAAVRGVLCFGPDRGRNVTWTSPRRWIPGFTPADPDVAVRELVRGYLRAYGPATPAQFARWMAASQGWATGLFRALAADLDEVDMDGVPAWLPAGDTTAPAEPPSGLRLLPYFDAYTVGSHPRDLVFPGPAATRALTRGQAGNVPVLLIAGVVAGVWHQRRSGRRLHVTVEPFGRLDAARRRALEDEVARVGRIQGADAQLTIGSVSVGRHL